MRSRPLGRSLCAVALWCGLDAALVGATRCTAGRASAEVAPLAAALRPWPGGRGVGLRGLGLIADVLRRVLQLVPWPAQVAMSRGRSLASLWSAGAKASPRVLSGHTGLLVDIKFFPRGDRLVTASSDGALGIWSLRDGRRLRIRGHAPGARLFEVQVFPDGGRIVSVGGDAAIIWDARSGGRLHRLRQPDREAPHRVARVLPLGDMVVTGVACCTESTAILWNASSGEELQRLRQPRGQTRHLELAPSGGRVVTAGMRKAWIWRLDGVLERELAVADAGWVSGVAFLAGAKIVASASGSQIALWNLRTGAREALGIKEEVLGVISTNSGESLIAFSSRRVLIFDADSGRLVKDLQGARDIRRVAASPSGDIVAACSDRFWPRRHRVTTVWDVVTGRRLDSVRDEAGIPASCANLSPCSVAVGVGVPPSLR